MKKLLVLILGLLFVIFSIAGCDENKAVNSESSANEASKSYISSIVTDVVESEGIASGNTENSQGSDVSTSSIESKPIESSEPVESSKPDESSSSVESSKPTESSKPIETSNSLKSSEPTESSNPVESSKPVHTHTFSSATCTEAQKCSCGTTKGVALGHKWGVATCTVPKTCSLCKATDGATLGHRWTEANCTAPKTCSVCKVTEGGLAKHILENFTCTKCGFVDEEGISVATNPKLSLRKYPYAYGIISTSSSVNGESCSIYTLLFDDDNKVQIGYNAFFLLKVGQYLIIMVQIIPKLVGKDGPMITD